MLEYILKTVILSGLAVLIFYGVIDIIRGLKAFSSETKLTRFHVQVNHELMLMYEEHATAKEFDNTIKPCFETGNSPNLVACAIKMERS